MATPESAFNRIVGKDNRARVAPGLSLLSTVVDNLRSVDPELAQALEKKGKTSQSLPSNGSLSFKK